MNTEKCFVKYKVQQYKKPRLEKCKAWQEPWLYYENCCPAEEYDLFMLLKQKVKNKELITVKDLKEFLRVENKKFEGTKIEIQATNKRNKSFRICSSSLIFRINNFYYTYNFKFLV